MKTKVIISLIMMVAMVLGTSIALAANFSDDSLTDVSSNGWVTTNGDFGANQDNNGIISTENDAQSRAAYPVTTDSSGAFTFKSDFKVNNASSDVHVGVSSGESSGDITIGWAHNFQTFAVVKDDNDVLGFIGGSLDPSARYTGEISSTDGTTYKCSLLKDGSEVGSTTVSGFKPAYLALYIEDYGATDGPTIYSADYESQAAASPSPSPSPSAQPGTKTASDLQGIRDFYASQPVVHMSNQSVVYNPDGTIKQVITGTTSATAPAVPATNATTPVVTTTPGTTTIATATAKPATATAVAPTTASPTKSQSPGFEIVLAAMGMIAALALITRKKK